MVGQLFDELAVSVPIPGRLPVAAHLHQARFADEAAALIDARKVHEALRQIGCVVKLYWKTKLIETRSGTRNRYTFHRGRLQLGQKKKGEINGKFELRLLMAPLVELGVPVFVTC